MRSDNPRVFVSSTTEDLAIHREVVRDVLLELQCFPVLSPEYQRTGETWSIPETLSRALDTCEAFILVQAFRRGWVPTRQEGGDGKRSIVELELAAPKKRGLRIYAFLAKESWPGDLWEHEARPQVMEFRKSIGRMARFFGYETPLVAQGVERLPWWAACLRSQLASLVRNEPQEAVPESEERNLLPVVKTDSRQSGWRMPLALSVAPVLVIFAAVLWGGASSVAMWPAPIPTAPGSFSGVLACRGKICRRPVLLQECDEDPPRENKLVRETSISAEEFEKELRKCRTAYECHLRAKASDDPRTCTERWMYDCFNDQAVLFP